MSSRPLPAIEIDVRLPDGLAPALVAAAAGAATVPVLLAPGLVSWLAAALVFAVFLAAFRRSGWLGGAAALRSARWDADGNWWLTDGRGTVRAARLGTGTRVFSGWLWLSWTSPAGGRHVLLHRGERDADTLRRLAARLRLAPESRPVEPSVP